MSKAAVYIHRQTFASLILYLKCLTRMVDKYYFVDSNESVQNHDIIDGKSGPPSSTAYDWKFFITTLDILTM